MRLSKSALALIAVLGLPALPCNAAGNASASNGTAQAPPASVPTLQVYSREIDVDVLITDAKGRPVYGLPQSDFTIAEDGNPQSIDSFQEFGPATPALVPRAPAADLHPAPPRLPPNVYTNFEATPATGPVNIVLLDTLSASPPLIDYAEEQTNEYIRTMPQGTQMAVFWLSGGGLHMLQGFTSDRDLLLKATTTNRTDFGIQDIRWTADWVTIDALNQIAAYVSGIKGRKNLIWFTPTMPVMLTRDGGYAWGQPPDPGMVNRLMDTYELFTAEQIAVDPVDPHGVHGLGKAQLRMQTVAEDTGGIAYYNSNDLRLAVSRAIQDGSHFYSIAYIPPHHPDDARFHKITVTVNRPGLHLVYRDGYNAEQPPQHAPALGAALMAAALDGKAPAATQLVFDARVQPATLAPSSAAASPTAKAFPQPTPYDVLYALPQSEVTFADGPGGTHTSTLKFALSAYDIDGKLVARLDQNVHLDLNSAQYRQFLKNPLQFHERFTLPPGQFAVRLGVLDARSNNVGTLEVPVFNWQTRAQAAAANSVVRLHGK